jgi:hypothetical protein
MERDEENGGETHSASEPKMNMDGRFLSRREPFADR